jgi:hypothetical protein
MEVDEEFKSLSKTLKKVLTGVTEAVSSLSDGANEIEISDRLVGLVGLCSTALRSSHRCSSAWEASQTQTRDVLDTLKSLKTLVKQQQRTISKLQTRPLQVSAAVETDFHEEEDSTVYMELRRERDDALILLDERAREVNNLSVKQRESVEVLGELRSLVDARENRVSELEAELKQKTVSEERLKRILRQTREVLTAQEAFIDNMQRSRLWRDDVGSEREVPSLYTRKIIGTEDGYGEGSSSSGRYVSWIENENEDEDGDENQDEDRSAAEEDRSDVDIDIATERERKLDIITEERPLPFAVPRPPRPIPLAPTQSSLVSSRMTGIGRPVVDSNGDKQEDKNASASASASDSDSDIDDVFQGASGRDAVSSDLRSLDDSLSSTSISSADRGRGHEVSAFGLGEKYDNESEIENSNGNRIDENAAELAASMVDAGLQSVDDSFSLIQNYYTASAPQADDG